MQSKYYSCTVSIVHNISTVQWKMEKKPNQQIASQKRSLYTGFYDTHLAGRGADPSSKFWKVVGEQKSV